MSDDPVTLEEYQERCKENLTTTGEGADLVTWFPCPGCAAAGWKGFPITAALDSKELREPSQCLKCERTFQFEIKKQGGEVGACVVLLRGAPMPPYLPEVITFS